MDIPRGVKTRPLCAPLAVCLINWDFSNCCNILRMMEPELFLNSAGMYPLAFKPPYLVRSFSVPIGPNLAMFLKMAAERIYHQSGLSGTRSRFTPVLTNLLQLGGETALFFLSSSAALLINSEGFTSRIWVIACWDSGVFIKFLGLGKIQGTEIFI